MADPAALLLYKQLLGALSSKSSETEHLLDEVGRRAVLAGLNISSTGVIGAPLGLGYVNVKDAAYGVVGDGVTDDRAAIATAVAAVPSGGTLYFPAGTYLTSSASPLVSIADTDSVTIRGAGRGLTILKQSGAGNIVTMTGTIENLVMQDLSFNGNDAAAIGLDIANAKDCVFERLSFSGCLSHCINLSGSGTLTNIIRACRFTAGVGAASAGRCINQRAGTSLRIEDNYCNVGGTNAVVRYETCIDVRDCDTVVSIGNVFDGATTGYRTNAAFVSIGEYWDTNATTGITGSCYIPSANNVTTIIMPRYIGMSKIDVSGISPYYLRVLGASPGNEPIRLYTTRADAANSGTSETDLHSYTMQAGVLSETNQSIHIRALVDTATNANNKRVRVYFGATVIHDSTSAGFSNQPLEIEATVYRTGAATQYSTARILTSTANAAPTASISGSIFRASPGETLSGTVVIKITGQSDTASSDLTAKAMSIDLMPA